MLVRPKHPESKNSRDGDNTVEHSGNTSASAAAPSRTFLAGCAGLESSVHRLAL